MDHAQSDFAASLLHVKTNRGSSSIGERAANSNAAESDGHLSPGLTSTEEEAVEWGAIAHAVVATLSNPPLAKSNGRYAVHPSCVTARQQQHTDRQQRRFFEPGNAAKHFKTAQPGEIDVLAVHFMFSDAVDTRIPKWKLTTYTKGQSTAAATRTAAAATVAVPAAGHAATAAAAAPTHVLIETEDPELGPSLKLQAAAAAAVYHSAAGEEAMLEAMPGGAECWEVAMHVDTHLAGQPVFALFVETQQGAERDNANVEEGRGGGGGGGGGALVAVAAGAGAAGGEKARAGTAAVGVMGVLVPHECPRTDMQLPLRARRAMLAVSMPSAAALNDIIATFTTGIGAASPTAAAANVMPFLGGHANAPAVKAAAMVANTVASKIASLHKQGYSVQVVGHSVGGAVASLATMQMVHDLPKLAKGARPLQCTGFGTPAACCSLLRGRFCSGITTVVNDDDMVPRLAARSVQALLESTLQYDWQAAFAADIEPFIDAAMEPDPMLNQFEAKYLNKYILRGVRYRYPPSRQVKSTTGRMVSAATSISVMQSMAGSPPLSSAAAQTYAPVSSTLSAVEQKVFESLPQLTAPGKCVHLFRSGLRAGKSVFKAAKADEEFIQRALPLSPTMASDHHIDSYMMSLESAFPTKRAKAKAKVKVKVKANVPTRTTKVQATAAAAAAAAAATDDVAAAVKTASGGTSKRAPSGSSNRSGGAGGSSTADDDGSFIANKMPPSMKRSTTQTGRVVHSFGSKSAPSPIPTK